VLSLASNAAGFRSISLNSCLRISGFAVTKLVSAATQLRLLGTSQICSNYHVLNQPPDISYCSRIQSTHVNSILQACPSLEVLKIERCVMIEGSLTVSHQKLEQLSAKVSCNIHHLELTTPSLKNLDLRDCKSLQTVRMNLLYDWIMLTDPQIAWLSPRSALQVVNCFRCKKVRLDW